MASRMGVKSVEGLLEGYDNHMVGFQNDTIQFSKLSNAISGTHPINEELLRISKILSI
jgi:6-phosphofructokinase 1